MKDHHPELTEFPLPTELPLVPALRLDEHICAVFEITLRMIACRLFFTN